MATKIPHTPPPVEQLLDAKQVAAQIGVSERQVRRWASAGELHSVKLGHSTVRFRAAYIAAFINAHVA